MGCLSRESIVAASDLPREKVDVPEWGAGAYVNVRSLTGKERDSWEAFCIEQREAYKSDAGFPGLRASMLVRCLVDDEGKRLFLDTDTEVLGAKSGAVLDRLWTVAARLNALTASDVDELKKNSAPTPGDGS
jgi:hypothetical protein